MTSSDHCERRPSRNDFLLDDLTIAQSFSRGDLAPTDFYEQASRSEPLPSDILIKCIPLDTFAFDDTPREKHDDASALVTTGASTGVGADLPSWMREGREWLRSCQNHDTTPTAPSGDGNAALFTLRELFSGSGIVTRLSAQTLLTTRHECDLRTKWFFFVA